MRGRLMLLALVASCGSSDKAAKHFCQNVRIVFRESVVMDLDKVRRGLSDNGQCSDVNEASASLRSTRMAFYAAAVPFRSRSEVARTLDALEKITLDELNGIRCYAHDKLSAAEVAALRERVDSVEAKVAAVAATCPSP